MIELIFILGMAFGGILQIILEAVYGPQDDREFYEELKKKFE